MSNPRQNSIRSAGYFTWDSATVASTTSNVIQFDGDASIKVVKTTDILKTALQGNIDETSRDLAVQLTGTPLVFPSGQSSLLAWIFPWANSVPVPGTSLFGSSDVPGNFLASNGDLWSLYNCAVTKMPTLTLDIGKPIIGPLEIVALIRNGYDPETAYAYYKIQTGQSYTKPKLGQQSGDSLGRQRYYGNWAAGNTATGNTTFTNFEAQAGWEISYELEIEPFLQQGRTRDYTLSSFRAMAKCIPIGPSMTDIDTCQGNTAIHGASLSSGVCGDLIITGQNIGTFTIKNAVLKTAGYMFGGKPIRNGEIGFVGTFNLSASTYTGGLGVAA